MSKQFEFDQTSLPSQYAINLLENHQMTWIDTRSRDIYRVLFTTIADVLKIHQSKNKERIGFILKDDKGNFKLGAILNYNKPEEGEEDDSGNWYLEMTFYPEDMSDIEDVYDNHSAEFTVSAAREMAAIASARFNNSEYMHTMLNATIDTLVNFLDVNAIEGEEVELILNGVFTASVVIEDGKKIMSIVPGEIIKQLIKADSIL